GPGGQPSPTQHPISGIHQHQQEGFLRLFLLCSEPAISPCPAPVSSLSSISTLSLHCTISLLHLLSNIIAYIIVVGQAGSIG
ncbi:hypothetical protein AKJ16_DCAP24990, partial [Drosera capensis]